MFQAQYERVEARDNSRVHNGNHTETTYAPHVVVNNHTANYHGLHQQAGALGESHHRKVTSWLSSVDFNNIHQGIRKEAELSGRGNDECDDNDYTYTGKWLWESDVFKKWLDRDIRELWYTGMPGVGKSTLVSIIIDRMTRILQQFSPRGQHGKIAYVYFTHNEHYPIDQILGSIIQQVVTSNDTGTSPTTLPRLVNDLYLNFGRLKPCDSERALIFANAIHELSTDEPIYIVTDAIDEADDELANDLITHLSPNEKARSRVSLLVTSRIWKRFQDLSEGFYRQTITANPADLQLFINHMFKPRGSLRRVASEHPEIMSEMRNLIAWKSWDIFLLAKLQVLSLLPKIKPSSLSHDDLRKVLDESLPAALDLDGMYARLSDRIMAQKDQDLDGQRAYRILAWVVLSPWQLSISELREVMASDHVTKHIGDPGQNERQAVMRDICDGLVTFHEDKIRLVHYTAEVYFSQNATRLFGPFQPQIARICSIYLSTPYLEMPIDCIHPDSRGENSAAPRFPWLVTGYDEFKEVFMPHDDKYIKRQFYYAAELLERFPLVPYAVKYLVYHMPRDSGTSIMATDSEIVLLLKEGPKMTFLYRWLELLNLIQPENHCRSYRFGGFMSGTAGEPGRVGHQQGPLPRGQKP